MAKTRTNISLDAALLAEARAAGLNVSAIAQEALYAALRSQQSRAWHAENAEALEARRAWIEAHGTALSRWQVLRAD